LEYPGANILVYTEYAESQRAAAAALADIGGTVLTIAGVDPEAERTRIAERFATEDNIVLISTDALAEGLNLHQRCFHLIHLDLPYNPNRLEQRNGRIDRYGQTLDPDIRYCYLVGTFEERLLLKLIQKYEAARACLDTMPNTLAVSSATGTMREPVFGGETGDLFAGLPRLVHSLDLVAEDTASEAWRDLLREIDRAFKAFEDMAVRHGWLSGGPVDSPPAPALGFAIADFIMEALPDGCVASSWATDLQGLPGYDSATSTVRLTNDPGRLRDAQGLELLYPGRTHPLTRRVVARLRASTAGQVAAGRGEISLLATFVTQTEDGRFCSVFALRQYSDGRVIEEPDWLRLADTPAQPDWDADFKAWAGGPALEQAAQDIADRVVAAHNAAEVSRVAKQEAAITAWLRRRADEICGPAGKPPTGDLFGAVSPPIDASSPEARLRACQADRSQSDATRRAATGVLAIYDDRPPPAPKGHRVRPLGLLLLVP